MFRVVFELTYDDELSPHSQAARLTGARGYLLTPAVKTVLAGTLRVI